MIRSRYRRITFFFAQVLISIAFWDLFLPRLGLRRFANNTRPERLRKIATRYRLLAVQMGGVLIKVGQFLSARVDVLPAEITRELSGLQDEVPAERYEDIRRVAEADLNASLADCFEWFDETPVAAASLGQVHRARVRLAGDETGNGVPSTTDCLAVVVKVQRPEIETIIATDLAALRTVGRWIYRYRPLRRRANVPALMDEFSNILLGEVDYLQEGKNAEKFGENFVDEAGVRVPRVIWETTTRRVLTLEDVQGIKITDYEAIEAAGVDRTEVARRLMDTYLKQIFEDSFFHADPHPGNLFVDPLPESEGEWELTFVDFGMAGRIPETMRASLREIVIAVGMRDTRRLLRAAQEMGVLLPEADLDLLLKAEEEVFTRFWGKRMDELTKISFAEVRELSLRFRDLLYNLPFQVPEDLILLGRAIGILSGICTGLDPEFNVWEGIIPYAQKLVMEEASTGGGDWLGRLAFAAQKLVDLPRRTESLLEQVERGNLAVHDERLAERVSRLERAVNRGGRSILAVGLLVAGVQLQLAGVSPWGELLIGIALLLGLVALIR